MSNVFVLSTGRCGSVTFSKACSHISNYTVGHESRCRILGSSRLKYPKSHIEIDNRLSFFLGALDKKYGDDAIYIHLRREQKAVSESYDNRWHVAEALMKNWAVGIARQEDFDKPVAKFMVETIEQNIIHFLKDKTKKMEIYLETIKDQFPTFLKFIDADFDLKEVRDSLLVKHNPTLDSDTYLDLESSATVRILENIVGIATQRRRQIASLNGKLGKLEINAETSQRNETRAMHLARKIDAQLYEFETLTEKLSQELNECWSSREMSDIESNVQSEGFKRRLANSMKHAKELRAELDTIQPSVTVIKT